LPVRTASFQLVLRATSFEAVSLGETKMGRKNFRVPGKLASSWHQVLEKEEFQSGVALRLPPQTGAARAVHPVCLHDF